MIFANVSMPFYKFGDLMFLQKIETEEWVPFIRQKFQTTNKVIERDEIQLLVELVDRHRIMCSNWLNRCGLGQKS